MDGTTRNTVKSGERQLSVVEGLRELDGARVTELADHLGYSKGSVHNHLSTLFKYDFVVREGDEYHLSMRFLAFGEYTRRRKDEYDMIEPYVEDLADQTQEAASFYVEERGRGVVVFREVGDHAPYTNSHVGRRTDLHGIAAGKAILAFLPEERVDDLVECHGLEQYTENTITDKARLRSELATIREQGYAVNDEEEIEGLKAIAAPIRRRQSGEVIGSVSVAGPTERMKGDWFTETLPETLLGVGNEIELNIMYE